MGRFIDFITGYRYGGYNSAGFNREGYDRDGYDRSGYDRDGYDRQGFDQDEYDRRGFDRDGYDRQGLDGRGFSREGRHRNGTLFDDDGYDRDGYDLRGFGEDGRHRNGTLFDDGGLDREGYDRDGYDRSGYDRDGYDRRRLDSEGFTKEGRDLKGLTMHSVPAGSDYPIYYSGDDKLMLQKIHRSINELFTREDIRKIYASAFALSARLAQEQVSYFSSCTWGVSAGVAGSFARCGYWAAEEFVSLSNTLCGTHLEPARFRQGFHGHLWEADSHKERIAKGAEYARKVLQNDLFDPAHFLRVVSLDADRNVAYIVTDNILTNIITTHVAFDAAKTYFGDARPLRDSLATDWLKSEFVELLPLGLRRRICPLYEESIFLPSRIDVEKQFGEAANRIARFLGKASTWWVLEETVVEPNGRLRPTCFGQRTDPDVNWEGMRPAFWIEL